ncbi:MAG: carbohydrate ABC transporter permease [Lachnospiraceae bacterium]|nr:carbohydrate ABC transporter permease [Lachnospiraceae bacterium]MBQ8232855.1 carbohydrate ABC transporter permease [Lachnospiraceae bacterium]
MEIIMKLKKKSTEDYVLDVMVYLILIILTIICLYPMWYVLVASFTSSTELVKNPGFLLWPTEFVGNAYRLVFQNPLIMNSFANSVKILIVALPINIVITMLCGYFLSCTGMMWKKPISYMIMFTMFFSGGLIPCYLNIRSLGLYNTIWALVLPGALSVYNAIICKTAIEAVPDSLKESAYIDGANDFQIIFKIILPLIKPTLAVLLLYYGVGHWNSWFAASIYIKDNDKLPVQNILRSILLANQDKADSGDTYNAYAETIKYAAIVISTVPVLCIYPFLQKYFAKGTMVGAVKG